MTKEPKKEGQHNLLKALKLHFEQVVSTVKGRAFVLPDKFDEGFLQNNC